MASSKRAEGTVTAAATGAATRPVARQDQRLSGPGDQARSTEPGISSGPAPAASRLDECTISCLTNAQYHACREAYLDTVHRWFMFLVIALGAAALTDVLPPLFAKIGIHAELATVKEACAAGAAILAALDLTFDLSNRARAHAMMRRRYFELLADLREGQKTTEQVRVCLERFSADEEPAYRVLFLACWNAAQQTVYGDNAQCYQITFLGNLFKNWFRRPAADYPVFGG